MPPSTIMLIRHGEKPTRDPSVFGVDKTGREDEDDLSVRGWQRAGALARFFLPRAGAPVPPLAVPTRLYAPDPTAKRPSKRALHTLGPLAHLSGIARDTRFHVGEEADLAAAVLSATGVALVAWEHRRIADIVAHLTAGAVTAPFWPEDRFDVVIVLDRAPGWRLTQAFQMLLPGDTDNPLPATGEDEENGT
ncbi:phosphoglycerate mutase family protein [Methylobacterium indicum]|uniref:Phosphoglycerate mutase n=1 Tax=Methylobacterium indicum TaxID=1775910 RepID=A0A8H8X0J3_9HYPH|nr:phosphoglycerate mutase family protein [Methylobacterium indicum]BCM87598.1 hypothetical protein mvi_60590 [Methylobacterium indicum]